MITTSAYPGQTLSGYFTLSYHNFTSNKIAFDATAQQVRKVLQSLNLKGARGERYSEKEGKT